MAFTPPCFHSTLSQRKSRKPDNLTAVNGIILLRSFLCCGDSNTLLPIVYLRYPCLSLSMPPYISLAHFLSLRLYRPSLSIFLFLTVSLSLASSVSHLSPCLPISSSLSLSPSLSSSLCVCLSLSLSHSVPLCQVWRRSPEPSATCRSVACPAGPLRCASCPCTGTSHPPISAGAVTHSLTHLDTRPLAFFRLPSVRCWRGC